ncbi:MAG: outer membrane beta-barrel protein [Nitrospiraceae bacterium]
MAAFLVQTVIVTMAGILTVTSFAQAETKVIPSISVGERYDSNVFYGFVFPGQKSYDFVTTVTPQVSVEHHGRLLDGTFTGGGIAEYFVEHPSFNYVGANGVMTLNLSQLVGKLNRNLQLNVTDAFYYTPTPPAFINPQAGESPASTGSSFATGVQPFRVTSTINTGRILGAYTITPRTSMTATYSNTYLRFGGTFGNPVIGSVFGVTSHAVSAGPQFKVSPRDTVRVSYTFLRANYTQGQVSGDFQTQGGEVSWSRLLTPTITATVTGGLQMLEPSTIQQVAGTVSTQGSTEQPGSILYVTSATLLWNYQENTAMTLGYSRSVTPGFYLVPVPLVSNVVTASVLYRLSTSLTATGSANYAVNEDTSSTISYTSYGGTLTLNYILTRTLTLLGTYSYYNFDSKFSGQQLEFDRNMVMLTLKATWN